MKKFIENRLQQLKAKFATKEIDMFMVLIAENRRYLSGFRGEDSQFDESAGALLITDSKLILATDSRFVLQAEAEAPLYEVICYKDGLAEKLPEILDAFKTKRLGFESKRISHFQYQKFIEHITSKGLSTELVETENMVEDLRMVKDQSEIDAIRRALEIAESEFMSFAATLKPGMSEKEAAWSLEKRLREGGADSLSFPTIVASGPNSALPHAIPGNRKLRKGEPILFDWGVKSGDYCSDISRTLIIGTPDNTFKKVHFAVLSAQQKAIEAVRPGLGSRSVDDIARKHIENAGYKDKFGHGLGHGVGLAVHEPPRLSPLTDGILKPQMVFTVEPGIYIPGWGGVRLENMVAVTKNGVEVLNRTDPGDCKAGV